MIKKNIFNLIASSFLCSVIFALHPAEQEIKQREEKLTAEEKAISFLKHINAGDTIETNAELAQLVEKDQFIYEYTLMQAIAERLKQIPPSQEANDPVLARLKTQHKVYLETHVTMRGVLHEINQRILKNRIQELLRSGATESTDKELKALATQNRSLFKQVQQEERNRKRITDFPRCAICQSEFDQGEQVVITKCNHLFHYSCFKRLLKHLPAASQTTTQNCPLCRAPIRELGAYNFTTGVRDIKPGTMKLRSFIVGTEKPRELTEPEQKAVRSTLLKLLSTEKRTAEQERTLSTLKEHFPSLYQQAYEDYGHKASLEVPKALEE